MDARPHRVIPLPLPLLSSLIQLLFGSYSPELHNRVPHDNVECFPSILSSFVCITKSTASCYNSKAESYSEQQCHKSRILLVPIVLLNAV